MTPGGGESQVVPRHAASGSDVGVPHSTIPLETKYPCPHPHCRAGHPSMPAAPWGEVSDSTWVTRGRDLEVGRGASGPRSQERHRGVKLAWPSHGIGWSVQLSHVGRRQVGRVEARPGSQTGTRTQPGSNQAWLCVTDGGCLGRAVNAE